MKGYWGHLEKNKSGWIKLTPEDTDDIWNLYNIISPGDEVESMTIRKVQIENSAGTTVDSHKMKILLAVKAEKVEVDLQAACLRVNGKNILENKHVKLGSYHTLELECDRYFKLSKASWDPLSLEIIRQSTRTTGKFDLIAIVLQEAQAYICTVTDTVRVVKTIQENLPKKKIGSAYEKAIEKFYSNIIDTLLDSFDLKSLKAIVLASPGTYREELHKRLLDLAVKDESKKFIMDCKSKFVKVQISSGQPSALQEALNEPRIAAILEDTKSVIETKLLNQFHKMHASPNTSQLTDFGFAHVMKAAKEGAVKVLLLSDSLFRSLNIKERKEYIDLVEEVRDNGGSVNIFVTGTAKEVELAKITGVAAILNFPIQ